MKLHRKLYRRTLLALLGITKVISSTEKSIPGKWHNVFDSFKVSTQALHAQLSVVDEEVTEEYQELERDLGRRIGKGKLYTQEDLSRARERVNRVEFQENLNNGI